MGKRLRWIMVGINFTVLVLSIVGGLRDKEGWWIGALFSSIALLCFIPNSIRRENDEQR